MTVEEKKVNTPAIILGVLLILALVAVIYLVMASQSKDGGGDTPLPEPTIIVPTVPPDVPYVTATTSVNVRTGPGTNYDSYGLAQAGMSAQVVGISEDSGWWLILIPSGQGWVSGEWVSFENPTGVEIPIVPAPSEE